MKRLFTTLVILTGLIGSAGMVWADDFDKGEAAYNAGNFEEAVKWYRKAAEQGDAVAQYKLAWMYENGEGVTQDTAEAVRRWHKAAEQGYAFAQGNLGAVYNNGYGVTQDDAKAAKWYRKAAEQGDASAQSSLGWMYENGTGVLQDTIAAHMWFNIAAANGNKGAVKNRDIAAKKLSSSDIVEAQKRAKRCMSSGYKDCD